MAYPQQHRGGREPRRGERGRRRDDLPPFAGPSEADLQKILNGDGQLLVDWADKIGKRLADEKLTTSQIRNVFGTLRQIQMRWQPNAAPETVRRAWNDTVLLRPKMAYFAKRAERAKDKSPGLETLRQVLDPAIRLLGKAGQPTREAFTCFVDFCESVVAYHTHYAGKLGE